jgi:ADP-ribose pyrophosphatase
MGPGGSVPTTIPTSRARGLLTGRRLGSSPVGEPPRGLDFGAVTVLQKPDSVIVVAVDGSEIVVVRQTRAGAAGVTLELPAGSLDPGETPEETAVRELMEECGLAAGTWRKLGSFWAAPDYATEFVHAFEATELVQVGDSSPKEDEEDLEVDRLPLRGVIGELSDANSLAALALWMQG